MAEIKNTNINDECFQWTLRKTGNGRRKTVSWTLGKLKPHKLSGGKNNEKH